MDGSHGSCGRRLCRDDLVAPWSRGWCACCGTRIELYCATSSCQQLASRSLSTLGLAWCQRRGAIIAPCGFGRELEWTHIYAATTLGLSHRRAGRSGVRYWQSSNLVTNNVICTHKDQSFFIVNSRNKINSILLSFFVCQKHFTRIHVRIIYLFHNDLVVRVNNNHSAAIHLNKRVDSYFSVEMV